MKLDPGGIAELVVHHGDDDHRYTGENALFDAAKPAVCHEDVRAAEDGDLRRPLDDRYSWIATDRSGKTFRHDHRVHVTIRQDHFDDASLNTIEFRVQIDSAPERAVDDVPETIETFERKRCVDKVGSDWRGDVRSVRGNAAWEIESRRTQNNLVTTNDVNRMRRTVDLFVGQASNACRATRPRLQRKA